MSIALTFKGRWNAVTNVTTLSANGQSIPNALQDGVGTSGDSYIIFATTANPVPNGGSIAANIYDRDLGSGVKSWIAMMYIYYDGFVWKMTGEPFSGPGTGTVTSVGLTASSGFTVTNSPITVSGDINIAGAGTTSQYINGLGELAPIPIAGSMMFMFSGIDSSIPTYEQAIAINLFTPGALATAAVVASTTPTLLRVFATNVGYPNVNSIPIGPILAHYDTQKAAGSNNYYTFFELYKRDLGGIETLLLTSDNTTTVSTNVLIQQTTTASNSSIISLLVTDRLVVKVYAVMISSTATITISYDSNTNARLTIPFSAGSYVTSVALSMPPAFNVSGSPITSNGTFTVTGAGLSTQFINGTGNLGILPSLQGSPGRWGTFYDTTDQLASGTTVPNMLRLNTTQPLSDGVFISGTTQITFTTTGFYQLAYSLQVSNTSATPYDIDVWLRRNGVDIQGASCRFTVPGKHGATDGQLCAVLSINGPVTASDYIEIMWLPENTSLFLNFIPAAGVVPAAASAIVSALQLTQIGIGYYGLTSSTSNTIGTGSKTFTTNLNTFSTAFTVGNRVRIVDTSPTNWMEGYINTFTGNTLNAIIDLTSGATTSSNWTFSLTGQPGSGGGGGTPGGSTKQVQYNNAGTFDGASLVNIDLNDENLVLVSTSGTTAAPTTGSVKVYSNNNTGVDELRISQGLGGDYGLQASLGQKSIGMIIPQANGTPNAQFNWIGVVTASPGTYTGFNKTYDAVNMAPNFYQLRCTTAAALNVAGEMFMNNTGRGVLLGNTSYGSGGKLIITFTLSTYLATERIFMGYTAAAGALTLTGNPSTIANMIGIGKDAADATLQLMYNDAAGTATKVDTGVTPSQNNVYRMTIFVPPISTSLYLTLEIIAKSGGVGVITTFNSGAITTNIPAVGSTLIPRMAVGTAGVATAVAWGMINFYEEQYF